MKKIIFIAVLLLTGSYVAFAEVMPTQTARFFNGPSLGTVTKSSANVYLSGSVLSQFSVEEQKELYFEYIATNQACIAIYPTPESCLPKKTVKGQTHITLLDLKPNTTYTVTYKKDNTIACITTPCPGNEKQGLAFEFTTKAESSLLSTNLSFRMSGSTVRILQDFLIQKGYLTGKSTGYFGIATFKAVKAFQKDAGISPTGFVGPKTRAFVNSYSSDTSFQNFEGVIESASTGCYSDGECSVTISGKKVVTTIGWSQQIVGSIKGTVNNIGDIQTQKIGSRAKVYAAKTSDGYTLYGNTDFYIEVLN